MARRFFYLVCAPIVLVACAESDPSGMNSEPHLRAEITTSTSKLEYHGSGEFALGGGREAGVPATFGVVSRSTSAEGNADFMIWIQQDGVPREGTYSLRVPEPARERWASFSAVYTRERDGVY